MAELNRVKVVIDEEVYELTSPEAEEHIQTVARYIDRKIKEIYAMKSEAAINARLRTLFISLNIADDLHKEMQERKNLEEEVRRLNGLIENYNKEISKLEEENALLLEKLDDIQLELTNARNELEEYIEVFEINDAMRMGKVTKLQR